MRVILAGTAVTLLVTAVFLVRPDPISKLDARACDLVAGMAGGGTLSGRVAIVEIDEQSLGEDGRWPWPRDLLGELVRGIVNRGAASVVLDMMLHGEDRGAPAAGRVKSKDDKLRTNDEALADALAGKPVVVGYVFRFDKNLPPQTDCELQPIPLAVVGSGESSQTAFFHPRGALCTEPLLSHAIAGSGFLNAAPDSDGKLRRIPLLMEYGEQHYPSLALAAISMAKHAPTIQLRLSGREASGLSVGAQTIRLEGPSSMRLRFRGPRRTFPYVSASSVLRGGLPSGAFQDKIVIVGGSAVGLPNPIATPVDPMYPDVEVEATAIDNLLQGDSFHRPLDSQFWELTLCLFTGLAATLLLARVHSWWSALVVVGMAGGIWAGSELLLSHTGLLLSPLPVTAVLACTFPVVTLLNFMLEKRRAAEVGQQLAEEREQSEEALRESESRYRRLVENINDAIIVDDMEGRLVFANGRFREWFGLEDKNIRDVSLEDYVAPEWREKLQNQRNERMDGHATTDQFEYEGLRSDGTRIWIEALVTNIEENGRIVGTQAALRDVTERKRIEAEYLHAQKMDGIGKLAGIVSHDFNNLLTVINGYCDLVLGRAPDKDEYLGALKQIRAAGERAAELTRNLLAFSRKQPAQRKVLDLNDVVASIEKMFARLVGEDVNLVTKLTPFLGRVLADSGQLHQVLMNLLVNARDAMPNGGTVTIETNDLDVDEEFVRRHPGFERGSYVYIGVADTGTGMTDEVRRRLFEPFFTTKEPGKGTGLGLATIQNIVQQNGGRIEVTTKLGEGTTFHIYLPRITTEILELSNDGLPVVAPPQGSETVLVVEDQDAVRRYVCLVLENSGYRVVQAADGLTALGLADKFTETIHLLVTDLVLPLMNGRDLAEQLKLTRPAMSVLFISGYSAEMIDSRGIIADNLSYLPKPFNPEQLRVKVREALALSNSSGSSNAAQNGRAVSTND